MSWLVPDSVIDNSGFESIDNEISSSSNLYISDNSLWAVGREFSDVETFKREINYHFQDVKIKTLDTWQIGPNIGKEKRWIVICTHSGQSKRKPDAKIYRRTKKCGKSN